MAETAVLSPAENFKQFVADRLNAAAVDIIGGFEAILSDYEEEISRQRKLLQVFTKPQVNLRRIKPPQQGSQLHISEEEPGALQMKEEPEDLYMGQEGEPVEENFMSTEDNQQLFSDSSHTFLIQDVREWAEQDGCHRDQSPSPDQEEPDAPQMKQRRCSIVKHEERPRHLQDEDNSMEESRLIEPGPSDPEHRYVKTSSQKRIHLEKRVEQIKYRKSNFYDSTEPETTPKKSKGPNDFHCEFCGKVLKDNKTLINHRRVHTGEKPFSCETCGKCFASMSNLYTHRKIHSAEKSYICKVCGKTLTSYGGFKYHLLTHSDEKSYACDICGKSFRLHAVLQQHLKTHTGEKPFSCEICGNSFRTSQTLKVHVRLHTGERPYTCDICGNSFIDRTRWLIHRRGHTGEKPYSCKFCDKRFKDHSGCYSHMRGHRGEKPLTCVICDKYFMRASACLKHMEKHGLKSADASGVEQNDQSPTSFHESA